MSSVDEIFKQDEESTGNTPSDDALSKIRAAENESSSDDGSKDSKKNDKKSAETEKSDESGTSSPKKAAGALGAAEAAAATADKLGAGFTPEAAATKKVFRTFLKRNRKEATIGGTIIGIIIALVVFAFLALIPLKIKTMIQGIQDHFYSSAQNATQKETQRLFQSYVKKYVLPGLSACSGLTIDKSCVAKQPVGTNPVSKLYTSWRTAKIENTMATKYGIEFKKVGNHYYIKGPSTSNILIDDFANGPTDDMFDSKGFRQAKNRAEFRALVKAQVDDALEGASHWKQAQIRFQVIELAKRKYGVKMCVFVCNTSVDDARQSLNDWKTNASRAFRLKVISAVDKPRADAIVAILECMTDANCTSDMDRRTTSVDPATNGEQITQLEATVDEVLAEDAAKIGATTAEIADQLGVPKEDLPKIQAEMESEGVDKYLAKQLILSLLEKTGAKAGVKTAATASVDVASKAIPIIGWVDLGAQLVTLADKGSVALQKAPYILNAATMVQTAMLFNAYSDEIASGNVSAELVGSMTQALGSDSTADQGGKPAEASPIYQAVMNKSSTFSTNGIKCNDGNAMPVGEMLCPEEKLSYDNALLEALHDYFTTNPTGQTLSFIASVWEHTGGWIISKLTGVLGTLISTLGQPEIKALDNACDYLEAHPNVDLTDLDWVKANAVISGLNLMPNFNNAGTTYCGFRSNIKVIGPAIMSVITQYVFPSPMTAKPAGSRNFNLLAGGNNILANKFCEDKLGCQTITDQQVMADRNEQIAYQDILHDNSSFTSRIFNTSDKQSMVTNVAMSIPISSMSSNGMATAVASMMRNPFSGFGKSLGNLLGISKATAATNVPTTDPFQVTQYGYPANDPVFTSDPETYWDDNKCDDPATLERWRDSANDTGDQTTTNPCLLIRSAVGSSGGIFDTSNLTADEQESLNGQPTSGGGTDNGGGFASSNPSAQAVLNSCKNNTATGKVKIVCASLTLAGLRYADPPHPFTKYLVKDPPSAGCNAFVDISILRATNGLYKKEYCSQEFVNGSEFKKIPLKDLQPGDIAVRESSCGCTSACPGGHDSLGRYGHVAVVVSYDAESDTIVVSEASSKRRPSGVRDPTTATWSGSNIWGFTYGLQYVGGGL